MTVILNDNTITLTATNRAPTGDLRRFTITSIEGETPQPGYERVRSEYVEHEWLRFLGPTAIIFARWIDLTLSTEHKYAVDVPRRAREMCVTPTELVGACHRLVRYGLAHWSDRDPMLSMARYWPRVPAAITSDIHRSVLLDIDDDALARTND